MPPPPIQDIITIRYEFNNETYRISFYREPATQRVAILSSGLYTLLRLIRMIYGAINNTPVAQRLNFARGELARLTEAISRMFVPGPVVNEFIIGTVGIDILGITPQFNYYYYETDLPRFPLGIQVDQSIGWPKYVNPNINGNANINANINVNINGNKKILQNLNSEIMHISGVRINTEEKKCYFVEKSNFMPKDNGIIILTPEFNVNTQFDNANFYLAFNDNFTRNIEDFIIAPNFKTALFIRPKLINKRKMGCKCKKCNKAAELPETSSNDLLSMVINIYQAAVSIQKEEISWDLGSEKIMNIVAEYDKYIVKGSRNIFYLSFDNGVISLYFIRRYNLAFNDCVVSFNLTGVNNFTNIITKDVLMYVSEVPIEENMSEAVYSPVTGAFAYGRLNV